MEESNRNRPPSFQFYPDIWQSHTRRLGDTAYRIYHEILCWMWLQSPDYCSIPKDPESIACLIALPCDRIATALQEIQNPHAPLLKERGDKYVSNRLRKEYEKLQDRRDKAVMAANKRWKEPMRTQCERNANASFEQCSPTPTPSPSSTPIASPAIKEEKDPNRIEMRLARSLLDSILSWKPDYKKPSSLDAWADEIGKAIRLDKRLPDKIEAIINWLPSHVGNNGFTWRANILSGAKLRAQYDKLDIAMRKPLSKKEVSYVQP